MNCQITHTQVVPLSPYFFNHAKRVSFMKLMICEKVTPRMESDLKIPVVYFGHIPNAYLKPMGPEK